MRSAGLDKLAALQAFAPYLLNSISQPSWAAPEFVSFPQFVCVCVCVCCMEHKTLWITDLLPSPELARKTTFLT